MLLYRVFPRLPGARLGAPGSATHLHHPQGNGRWDNPSLYDAWYLSTTPEGAVAESFGNLLHWTPEMFEVPFLPGASRAVATFSIPDDLPIVDLDGASTLVSRGMRPTQVVIRNPGYTQGRAATAFAEQEANGRRRWAGLSWWSFHRPVFTNVALWATPTEAAPLTLLDERVLSLRDDAVIESARILSRPL